MSEALKTDNQPPTPIRFTPFTRELPIPPTLVSTDPFDSECTSELAGSPTFHQVRMRKALTEIIPGVQTEIWGYNGLFPGPTLRMHDGEPVIVRQINELDVETSVHLHGGHNPSASDGFPNDFIFPGSFKDYCYPNVAAGGDPNENPSTLWYHDHAMDITAPNVYHGLAAFSVVTDALEDALIDSNVLPAFDFDVPMVLQDRRFNADGSLFFDPLDHDGFLGDVFVVNGKAQPFFRVQRRKYRFRFLNGNIARVFLLRLSTGQPFLQIAKDSWLLPFAVRRDAILLSMAERVDVIVDFSRAPSEVFLLNVLDQKSGRGPQGDLQDPGVLNPGVPLVKFIVEGGAVQNDATVDVGTPLRPHTPIRADEIVATRVFEFNRSDGAWQVNDRFFDPDRVDANPRLGAAERWIFKNGGGGWWHPIHVHLDAHQVQRIDGKPPPVFQSFKSDTTLLGPGTEAEVFIRFRDFPGRFVMHCHTVSHEDDRMMVRFDVVPT